jgi:ParB family transcriptional regulator, chromosome partitioning protein
MREKRMSDEEIAVAFFTTVQVVKQRLRLASVWKPTVDNYLGRVTKPRILEAVREATGETSVQLIDHLKKADMAREAERLLDGAGWLPEPLRLTEVAASTPEQEGQEGPLPEFLADEEDKTDNEDEQPSVAAE